MTRVARGGAIAVAVALISSLVLLRAVGAGSVQVLPPVTEADGSLGLCDILPGTTPDEAAVSWAQLAYDAGARVDRWELRWDRIESQQELWDFTQDDPAVQAATASGLKVLGILIGTPAWAAAAGQPRGNGLPRGLFLDYNDPNNLWADYVRETVSHYEGKISYWEVWNEPDISYFWKGTPQDYYQLLKVAYLTIKSVDPNALVLSAGMVVPDLSFASQVLTASSQDPQSAAHNGYFDAVAWHAYGNAVATFSNITAYRALLAARGRPQTPLWVTEDGFPASNPNGEARQAAYVEQTIAYALAAGAQKVLVYRASDDVTPKNWGLLSALGDPRMGYVAFQVAARYFARSLDVVYAPGNGVERFSFYEPGRRLTLYWTKGLTDQALAVPADQPTAQLVDSTGTVSTLHAVNGEFDLRLPGADYNAGIDASGTVVGGPPIAVIENNNTPTGLSTQFYVSSVSGPQRQLVILNQGNQPATVWVAASAQMRDHALLQIVPHSVQTVDLDLLASPGYNGPYMVSSNHPVEGEAVSTASVVRSSTPSTRWFMAAAPASLSIGNPHARQVGVIVRAVGAKGVVRLRQQLTLLPNLHTTWILPAALQTMHLSVTVTATGPVLLGPVPDGNGQPVARPAHTWYAVHPAGRLSVFNPSGAPARVHVRWVGGHGVQSRSLTVTSRHLSLVPLEHAHAVMVSATRAVVASYASGATVRPPITSHASTRAALTVAGPTTALTLFNPSRTRAAQVRYTIVRNGAIHSFGATVPPLKIIAIPVRGAQDPPRGLVVTSNLPVVAAATGQ